MKIPPKIMIGEHEITIEIFHDSKNIQRSGDYNDWYGLIRINVDGCPESVQAGTLLHEIVEGINAIFELGLEHPKIVLLSEMLFQTIRRNKLDFINP